MSLSTLGLVSKGLLIADCRQARCPPCRDIMGWSNTRPRPGCFAAFSSTLLSHFFVLSIFYEVLWRWSFLGERCPDHWGREVCRPSDYPALAVSCWWCHWSRACTHTLILCRLVSGCLSTRLHRWLTVSPWSLVPGWVWVVCCISVPQSSKMHWWNGAWFTLWHRQPTIWVCLPYELICDSTNSLTRHQFSCAPFTPRPYCVNCETRQSVHHSASI